MAGSRRKNSTLLVTSREFFQLFAQQTEGKLKEPHLSPELEVPSRVIISRKYIASVPFISRTHLQFLVGVAYSSSCSTVWYMQDPDPLQFSAYGLHVQPQFGL